MPTPEQILQKVLENFQEKNQEWAKKDTPFGETFSKDHINHYFSLEEGVFRKSNLESEVFLKEEASKGDPFSLMMLGKLYYDRSGLASNKNKAAANKAMAFKCFNVAIEKGDTFLAHAVAEYIKEEKEKMRYYRIAISKAKRSYSGYDTLYVTSNVVTASGRGEPFPPREQLQKLPNGYFHAFLEEFFLAKKDKASWRSDMKNAYNHFGKQFAEWDKKNRAEFDALCRECPIDEIVYGMTEYYNHSMVYNGSNSTDHNNYLNRYFLSHQVNLADRILTIRNTENIPQKKREEEEAQIKSKYHPDYLNGVVGTGVDGKRGEIRLDSLETTIAIREKQMEEHSQKILEVLKEDVLSKMRGLLNEARERLLELNIELEEDDQKRDSLTNKSPNDLLPAETSLLQRILQEGDENNVQFTEREGEPSGCSDFKEVIKNNKSIYLELKAFIQVGAELGIKEFDNLLEPTSTEASAPSLDDHDNQPGAQEVKPSSITKLKQVVKKIEAVNGQLETMKTPTSKWKEFFKFVLATCSVAGIGLMLYSSYTNDTYKFWDTKEQVRTKSKASFFNTAGTRANNAIEEVPHLRKMKRIN